MSVVQLQIPAVKPDESDMQRAFYRGFSSRYELVATNLYLNWYGGEMDIFGMRKSGFVDEIEIKLSVSDFKADFKKEIKIPSYSITSSKPKHTALADGEHVCNYFSFLLPAELVDKCEIPEHAGLYVFNPSLFRGVQELKKAPRLHTRKISERNKYDTARKMHYRYWDIMMQEGR